MYTQPQGKEVNRSVIDNVSIGGWAGTSVTSDTILLNSVNSGEYVPPTTYCAADLTV